MANLNLYFELYSKDIGINIIDVSKKLSTNNVLRIYSIGDKHGQHIRKNNNISYRYTFENITSIDVACEVFLKEWEKYKQILIELNSSGFTSLILFEFDLPNYEFPELIFTNELIRFLADTGIELQLFFYAGE